MLGINKGMSHLCKIQEHNLSVSKRAFVGQETLVASVCVHVLLAVKLLDSLFKCPLADQGKERMKKKSFYYFLYFHILNYQDIETFHNPLASKL